MFELIRESKVLHPGLCVRALQAQLNMLQGQQPEGLKHEPPDIIGTPHFGLLYQSTNIYSGSCFKDIFIRKCSLISF